MSQTSAGSTAPPSVSFSTLAKVMGPLSPVALASRLRAHKYPTDGPKRSYQNALRQAVEHFVNGTSLNPLAANLRSHEQDAVAALAAMSIALPRGAIATRAPHNAPRWKLAGVSVSVVPDAVLTSGSDVGAIKLSLSKEPLPRGVGTAMAALLWHYQSVELGIPNVKPSLCIVYEPRASATYRPGLKPSAQVQTAVVACQVIAAVWPGL